MITNPTRSEVLRALADGMTVEIKQDGGWRTLLCGMDYTLLSPMSPVDVEWRILDPPAPKRLIPLGPEDVPPGSVIRHATSGHMVWSVITAVRPDGIYVGHGPDLMGWNWLQSDWEISSDGGKTWQRCEKEEA